VADSAGIPGSLLPGVVMIVIVVVVVVVVVISDVEDEMVN